MGSDSLLLAGQLELLGRAGATYNVMDGQRQFGDPQAITQIVKAQLTMGSYVTGDFTDNRTISLQIGVWAPNRLALALADSALRKIVNSTIPTTLQYTPDGGYPLMYDIFRGQIGTAWSRKFEAQGWRIMTVTWLALPFGRSTDQRVVAGSTGSVQLADFTASPEPVYYTPSDQNNYYPGEASAPPYLNVGTAYSPVSTPPPIEGATSMRVDTNFFRNGFASCSEGFMIGPVSGTWNLVGCPALTFGFYSVDGFYKEVEIQLTDSHGVAQLFRWDGGSGIGGWQYATLSLAGATIDLSTIVSWQLWMCDFQGNNFTQQTWYLGSLRAYPAVGSIATTTNGAIFKLAGILGDARAPASIRFSRGLNLLTAVEASFDGVNLGQWAQQGSTCVITQSTTQALDGTHSMRLASTGSGTNVARSVTRYPVIGGLTYTLAASFRSAVTARACGTIVIWIDAAGNNIGNMQGATVNDTTSGWTRAFVTGLAPAAAVACLVGVSVNALTNGELHYVDEVSLNVGTSSAFTVGTPWPTITGFLAYRAPSNANIDTPSLIAVVAGHATTIAPAPLGGTYRAIGVNSTTISAGASMTVTQKVNGTTVATATLTSLAVAGGTNWGDFGDITLPLIEVPDQAGTVVTYDFAFTGTDLILADTRGFMVWVPTMTAAAIIWIDEATALGMGGVFAGTAPDRSDATSLLGLAGVQIAGAMSVDPDDNYLLMYALDGAPGNVEVLYYDRYLGERTAA